jgi:hypothetical protein
MDSDKTVTATFDVIDRIETFGISNIKIFPNPFKNHITITNTEDVVRIAVCNFLGQTFIDMQIKDSQTYIPTDILSPGIYLINIYKENKMVTKKIIKI